MLIQINQYLKKIINNLLDFHFQTLSQIIVFFNYVLHKNEASVTENSAFGILQIIIFRVCVCVDLLPSPDPCLFNAYSTSRSTDESVIASFLFKQGMTSQLYCAGLQNVWTASSCCLMLTS